MRSAVAQRHRRCFAALLACLGLSGAMAAAGAEPMQANWTTYLRAGPGREYAALDEVEAKSVLEVAGCDRGWCRVAIRGRPDGYVDESIFSRPDIHARPDSAAPRGTCFTAPRNGSGAGEAVRYCSR